MNTYPTCTASAHQWYRKGVEVVYVLDHADPGCARAAEGMPVENRGDVACATWPCPECAQDDVKANPFDRIADPVEATRPERGNGAGSAPVRMPTEKQVAYLRRLAAERAVEVDEKWLASAKAASVAIDKLLAVKVAPTPAATAPTRSNRYDAPCVQCGTTVPAGAGSLDKVNGRWVVAHVDGCPTPTPTPAGPQKGTEGPVVAEGHYAIASTGDNDLAFYRVDHGKGEWAGRVFVKMVVGGKPDRNVARSHTAGILARIAADPDAGPRYGQEIGRCCVCNRHLTDETSRALGIGPDCRTRG